MCLCVLRILPSTLGLFAALDSWFLTILKVLPYAVAVLCETYTWIVCPFVLANPTGGRQLFFKVLKAKIVRRKHPLYIYIHVYCFVIYIYTFPVAYYIFLHIPIPFVFTEPGMSFNTCLSWAAEALRQASIQHPTVTAPSHGCTSKENFLNSLSQSVK